MNGFEFMLFAGNSNPALSQAIAKELKTKISDSEISKFANGEIKVTINESVRGKDVFLIQTLCEPVNEHLIEMLIFVDALKRASADRITLVIPHFAYARQDKKFKSREPISAKLIANLIQVAGTHRVLTIDLHSAPIQGFFDIPVDNLTALSLFDDYIAKQKEDNFVIVAPDEGAMKKTTSFANATHADIAFMNKIRPKDNEAEILNVVGEVNGRNCIIMDDMIDTAGTIAVGIKALKERGAQKVFVCATHALLSGNAVEKLNNSDIEEVVLTDTIPLTGKELKNLKILSVAPLLAKAINNIHKGESVSSLFKNY
ncbi:MAG: ribose-phosphate pyrophosphokinase [archaeon]|nr:ribose-phosphate pyrophosphokinase [archaeon]